jgi:hypothetical protein
MITLEKEFVSGEGGFSQSPLIYTQIIRNDNYAVYQRSDSCGKIKDYEVFRIKIQKAGLVIFQKTVMEDTECYTVTSAFGKSAWSFHGVNGKQAAINKFNELNSIQAVKDDEPVAVNVPSKFNNTTFVFPATFSIKDFAETNKCEYITASLFVKEQIAAGSVKQVGEERRAAKGPMSKIYSKV